MRKWIPFLVVCAACADRAVLFDYESDLGDGVGGVGIGVRLDGEGPSFPVAVTLRGRLVEDATALENPRVIALEDAEAAVHSDGSCTAAADPVCDEEGCSVSVSFSDYGICALGVSLEAVEGPGAAECFTYELFAPDNVDEVTPGAERVVAACEDAIRSSPVPSP